MIEQNERTKQQVFHVQKNLRSDSLRKYRSAYLVLAHIGETCYVVKSRDADPTPVSHLPSIPDKVIAYFRDAGSGEESSETLELLSMPHFDTVPDPEAQNLQDAVYVVEIRDLENDTLVIAACVRAPGLSRPQVFNQVLNFTTQYEHALHVEVKELSAVLTELRYVFKELEETFSAAGVERIADDEGDDDDDDDGDEPDD